MNVYGTTVCLFNCVVVLLNSLSSRGAVANMLVTSCMDNVSRIWVETILPDDGLVDFDQFDPSVSHDPKHHTQRHKKRFVQRLKTIRSAPSPLCVVSACLA